MNLSKAKFMLAEFLGYVFCEFSFRWFELIDVPYHDEEWKWYHHGVYFIGSKPYALGCYFYNVGINHESR